MTTGLSSAAPHGPGAGWAEGTRLFLLPFDQGGSFKNDLLGLADSEALDDAQRAWICDLKALIFEGLEDALVAGAPKASVGVLVDEEEFGDDIACRSEAGWIGYHGAFYRSELHFVVRRIDEHIVRWVMQKFNGSEASSRRHEPGGKLCNSTNFGSSTTGYASRPPRPVCRSRMRCTPKVLEPAEQFRGG